MAEVKTSYSNLLMPIMVQFRRLMPKESVRYRYDDTLQLNLAIQNGKLMPAVQVTEIKAKMKTDGLQGGED